MSLGTNESAIYDRSSGWGHSATTATVPTTGSVNVVAYDGQGSVPSVTANSELHGTSGTGASAATNISTRGQGSHVYNVQQDVSAFPSNGSSPLEAQLAPGRGLNDRTGLSQVGTDDGSWAVNGVTVYDNEELWEAAKVGEKFHDGAATTESNSTNFTSPAVGSRDPADRTSGWGHGAVTVLSGVGTPNAYHD